MKILIASDLHYRLKQLDWLASQAADYSAVIIAGDMLDISSWLDLSVQVVVMKKCLQRIASSSTLLVCSGNHDGNEKNQADEFVAPWLQDIRRSGLHVDGDNVFFGNVLFTIFPWWDGDITREEVAHQFRKASKLDYEKWVWVYHAPPDRSLTSWAGKKYIGDRELNQWIEEYQPDLVITGHIHQSPFRDDGSWVDRLGDTWVFNGGSQIGDIPAHIILDLHAMEAEWISLAGIENRQLR